MGRGGITLCSTCACGGVPGLCVPSCKGGIIGLSCSASFPIERPVVLDLNSSTRRAALRWLSTFGPSDFDENEVGAEIVR